MDDDRPIDWDDPMDGFPLSDPGNAWLFVVIGIVLITFGVLAAFFFLL